MGYTLLLPPNQCFEALLPIPRMRSYWEIMLLISNVRRCARKTLNLGMGATVPMFIIWEAESGVRVWGHLSYTVGPYCKYIYMCKPRDCLGEPNRLTPWCTENNFFCLRINLWQFIMAALVNQQQLFRILLLSPLKVGVHISAYHTVATTMHKCCMPLKNKHCPCI